MTTSNKKNVQMKKLNRSKNLKLFSMTIPGLVVLALFAYLPMFGIIIAFKNFRYADGILGSPWAGFDNFQLLFKSADAVRILRNTLCYNAFFIILDMVCAVFVAILLFQITKRTAIKFYQTSMLIPHFVSWVIVSYIVYIFLSPENGLINSVIASFGGEKIQWYSNAKFWPFILTVAKEWKGIGMSSIMYYAVLIGMDTQLLEAAEVDGAGKIRQIWHIMVPTLVPTMIILGILAVGNIFRGDFGLFYQVPRNVGALYETTDVIDTYVYRALRSGNVGISSATGVFQSVIGLFTVWAVNAVVRKIDPDRAMF